jgi:hypothetical protein
MTDGNERDLRLRLESLERRQRYLARAGTVALLAVIAVALLGQAPQPPKTVEAETFLVRDKDGVPRASLTVGVDGRVGFALADRRQKIRAWVTVTQEGAPELRFYDAAETLRAGLTLDPAGTPRFFMADKSGKARARFELGGDGAPTLRLLDGAEKDRAAIGVDGADFAVIRVADAEGRAQATMSVRPFGMPALALNGRDGKVVWKAP